MRGYVIRRLLLFLPTLLLVSLLVFLLVRLILAVPPIAAIPLGIYSAIRQDTVGDYVGRSLATMLIALPNFWVAVIVVLFGSVWFDVSPSLKPTPFITNPLENLEQFIVPAVVMGMAAIGGTARMMRSMMLEVLRQDYIRTAWAKGLKERVVILRHALKNALIPVITGFGLQLRNVMGGAVIIETIFSLPGLGYLVVQAANERDYPVVTGAIFVFAVLLMVINLAIDLTYGYLDPRIHYK
ncbi:Dipeptide transport system permease protein DppB [subsurface metagenome]